MKFRITSTSGAIRTTIRGNLSLRAYLQKLSDRVPTTPRSWLFEHEDATSVLNRWVKQLDKYASTSAQAAMITEFDKKQIAKFGPQGGHPPVREGIEVDSFSDQYSAALVDPGPFRSLGEVLAIPEHSITYRSFLKVIENMDSRDTLMTNSGYPLFAKRKLSIAESIYDAQTGAAYSYPAILLFRFYNGKLRIVWMYPMSMNLLEYQSTQPLQAVIQKSTAYVTPWIGFDAVKARFTELWNKHPYAFGGDTTAMDAHMQLPQLQRVGDAIAPCFEAPEQCLATLEHVAKIDILIGVDSIIKDQTHGVASGSGWTQLSETIYQILMFDRFIQEKGLDLSVNDGMGIGDDYVWFFDSPPSSEEIVQFWEKTGLPGKPEKQSNELDRCTFLQRLFIKGYMSRENPQVLGGIYPTIRALNSLLHPERMWNSKDWSSDAFCIRCYQILENCVDHPLFEEFVKFIVVGQKDLLPFAKQKPGTIDRIGARIRKKLPGLSPSYNQEKRDKPLSQYQSVRIAASL